jgi:hypothetical protein
MQLVQYSRRVSSHRSSRLRRGGKRVTLDELEAEIEAPGKRLATKI